MKLQKKEYQRKPVIWKWTDMYTICYMSYAESLAPAILREAVAVVNYDVKNYKQCRRMCRRESNAYGYLSMCIDELQMFLGNAKEVFAKRAAQPGPAGT